MKKILATVAFIVYLIVTAILGISVVGLLVFIMADLVGFSWWNFGTTLLGIIKE